jgi:hypothetical protein
MIEYDRYQGYAHDYRRTYAGLPVVQVPGGEDGPPDAASAAWRIEATGYGSDDETFEGNFASFVKLVDTTRVTAMIIGNWGNCYESGSGPVVRLLTESAARFPALRSLFFGAVPSEEAEISWIRQSDVTPLLTAFPLLERLEVRGGSGLRLSPVRHEALRMLRIESGGLGGDVVRAVAGCDLPALEHLELWLGVEEYGGDATLADLANVLSGERLPALRYLGLQDSETQDEIAAAVATAPVVARLETLSLSMGTLSDAGAESLLSGQPLTHLRKLDLHHHYLGDAMIQRVAQALPGVEVDLSDQETPEEDEEDEWRYVAVDE